MSAGSSRKKLDEAMLIDSLISTGETDDNDTPESYRGKLVSLRKSFQLKSAVYKSIPLLKTLHESELEGIDSIEMYGNYLQVSEVLLNYFPGVMSGLSVVEKLKAKFSAIGITAENTLFGQSVCPDEINHERGCITELLTERFFGKAFHLGGLGGIPFVGKTGFRAFSLHIPFDGNLFILYAPHIGIDELLELGKFTREGQHSKNSTACGAAVGAFKYCCEHLELEKIVIDPDDYQMGFIKHSLYQNIDEILAGADDMIKHCLLSKHMFQICKNYMDRIVTTDFGDAEIGFHPRVILLGGIQVNTPHSMPDFFQPLVFEMRQMDSPTIDFFPEVFP